MPSCQRPTGLGHGIYRTSLDLLLLYPVEVELSEQRSRAISTSYSSRSRADGLPVLKERVAVAAVRPLVEEAKRCYADSFDSLFTDSEFTNMMVVDGCFLLAVMAVLTEDYPYEHGWWTHGRMLRIMKDILLFENQIPWAVLDRLMALRSVKVESFVADIILAYFDLDGHNREPPSSTQHHSPPLSTQHQSPEHRNVESPFLTPPESPEHRLEAVHLLDLVHQRYLGRGRAPDAGGGAVRYCNYARAFAPFTSAVELAEAGIHLQGSGTCRVTDVRVEEDLPAAAMARLSIGRLVLPRLALSWLPRCWLINMVALECVTDRSDNSGVSSYLAILGSLVRAERDVEELRARRILFSTMSDRRTVEFFEGILDPLPRQELYLKTLEGIVQLRARRSTRSGIHAFLYKNRKIIFALAPLLSLLVAIVGLVVNNSIKHKY
ncbi:hypothetical protein HU200_032282 [Digitaria exilis]|uniref:Uncharacterized protein n=1 Tax=Digitaria exilis TaxID=1010633 RepID=A0A835BPL3_9POAL|nr:hypothetical protein HU200_032282 [Digitaria exilis]